MIARTPILPRPVGELVGSNLPQPVAKKFYGSQFSENLCYNYFLCFIVKFVFGCSFILDPELFGDKVKNIHDRVSRSKLGMSCVAIGLFQFISFISFCFP